MTRSERKEILETSLKVRKAVAAYILNQEKHGDQMDCWDPERMDCACGIASRFLVEILRKTRAGTNAQIVVGTYEEDGHAWAVIENTVIDLTLTQFSRKMPEVMIRRNPRWFKEEKRGNPEDCKALFNQWTRGQYPTQRRMNRLHKIISRI